MPSRRPRRSPRWQPRAREILGIDRFIGPVDLGGLLPQLVSRSIELLATEVAPTVRKAAATSPMTAGRKP